MPTFSDPVAVRNPKLPGRVVVVSRRQLPALAESGWVEAKSPAAKKAVEQASPEGTTPTSPSKEDDK
jgi:hypothetical protein